MPARILIADDEVNIRKVLQKTLQKHGYETDTAEDGLAALAMLSQSEDIDEGVPYQLLISDVRMPNLGGMELLEKVTERYPDLPVVMLTAHGTVDLAVLALKKGAFDFLTKPYERQEMVSIVKKAIAQGAHNTQESHSPSKSAVRVLVGDSPQITQILEVIERVADTPSTVLITGESGTGKELVAKAMHERSGRSDKPFIKINCAAIPETLLEAELFGHEKGAFTGAIAQKPGRFELADGGTLFLDEIGEMPVEMQVKLLRALQESAFERVGGVKTITVDVRLVAATNKNLEKAIAEGVFREDLFYRLNVVPVHLPPLRERTSDIPALATHFLAKFNARLGKSVEELSKDAEDALRAYSWPGNIRELENIIERTLLFCDGARVTATDLPPEIAAKPHGEHIAVPAFTAMESGSMKDIVRAATAELERGLIAQALEETEGNVTHAARRLKISRKSLQIKMKDFGLRDSES